jgi:polyisoprenoid-binding protein YceI
VGHRTPPRRRATRVASLLALLALGPVAGTLGADSSWRVGKGEVRVVCPMTVGGSFEAKTGAIKGTVTTGAAGAPLGGELSVDLSTLDTGIALRNEHMKKNYLEVEKGQGFDHAVLSGIRLGEADPQAVQGKTAFTGRFLLHGTMQPVSGQATIRREGKDVRIEASFPVSISAFGIEKPQYLGVGVRDQVTVDVSLTASPAETAGATP